MSLIRNTLSGEKSANVHAAFAMLCAAALVALVPTWLYVDEPLRAGIFFSLRIADGCSRDFGMAA